MITTADIQPEPMVTAEVVAELLGVSRTWVYRHADEDDLPYYRIGRERRFRLSEVESWIRANAGDAAREEA